MTDDEHNALTADLAETTAAKFAKGDPMALYALVSAAGVIAITQMTPALAAKLVRDTAEFVAQLIEERFIPSAGESVQ